jgi:hypothetical protein
MLDNKRGIRNGRILRLPILLLVMTSLLAALWAGLVRMGWNWPVRPPMLPALHGPLMVCGFLGTLIGLERAVARQQKRWFWGPLLTGVGAAGLLMGLPMTAGQVLILLGSASLTAVSLSMVRLHPAHHTRVMAAGAVCWLVGNGLWLADWPIYRVVGWWAGFIILTIVGERLELNRVRRLSPLATRLFLGATAVFMGGLLLSLVAADAGMRLMGAGMVALALWLLHYDIARRTVRKAGLTRYIGLNLLLGYGWLLVGGTAVLLWGALIAGPQYDFWLHTIFLGFTFGMIFAHALIILPAITGVVLPYRPIFYLPTALLHASLLLRLVGDFDLPLLRRWGGLLNATAILLFIGLVIFSLIQIKRHA